jgi:hypothetical protein
MTDKAIHVVFVATFAARSLSQFEQRMALPDLNDPAKSEQANLLTFG